ncbi:hypothetical protein GDO81_014915 [Engystomops pustulosus]|uniref:Ig-like domain-containing protein n=1 Tax=Engystomops pustulosus TaxID=76066 RepID=A0AAV7AG61_ENGPU|nr:hypothetical protein GDO81_014915 [Engystomops pustulosus]
MPVRTAKAMVTVLGVPQEPQITGYDDHPRNKRKRNEMHDQVAANQVHHHGGARNSETRDANGKTFTVVSLISFPVTKADDQVEITCTVGHESMPNTFKSSSQKLQVLCKPMKYTWMRKNSELPNTVITDHNSLVFQNLNKSDSGTYMCQVSNPLGDYIAEYKLDVNDPSPIPSQSSIDHAVIGGVVAVIAFLLFCLLIVLGRYLIRHKGTYLTHEAKGSDDAPDADTAIINAEGGQGGSDDKKEYFI